VVKTKNYRGRQTGEKPMLVLSHEGVFSLLLWNKYLFEKIQKVELQGESGLNMNLAAGQHYVPGWGKWKKGYGFGGAVSFDWLKKS